jgi:uncharacterized surface protein with fasciclin (FAS1) repeats
LDNTYEDCGDKDSVVLEPGSFCGGITPEFPETDLKQRHPHLTRTVLLISMAAAYPAAHAECAVREKPKVEEKAIVEAGTLTAMISDSRTFSTLTKCLKAAELDVTPGTKGDFAIFTPTDEAFGKVPAETLTKLILPENKEKLRMLLLYHVVAGRMLAADLQDGDVETMNGEKLEIDADKKGDLDQRRESLQHRCHRQHRGVALHRQGAHPGNPRRICRPRQVRIGHLSKGTCGSATAAFFVFTHPAHNLWRSF